MTTHMRFAGFALAGALISSAAQAQLLPALRPVRGSAKMSGKDVDHVVVMMLENRSFDHFMGWLYDNNVRPKNHYPGAPGAAGVPENQPASEFLGLSHVDRMKLKNPFMIFDPESPAKIMHQGWMIPIKGARHAHVPSVAPHEDFIHIQEDMWNKPSALMKTKESRAKLNLGPVEKAPMSGFVQNFGDAISHHRPSEAHYSRELLSEIMDTYVPEQLPVLSGLARHFAVSDLWFCSVPSQTNANRAFWSSGTSAGMLTNNFYDAYAGTLSGQGVLAWQMGGSHADALPPGTRTLFDVLEEKGVSWEYFWETDWPPKISGGGQYFRTMFSQFKDSKYDGHFPKMAEFLSRAEEGTLKKVTFVEPGWGGGEEWDTIKRVVGHEFHPVGDTTVGEFFVKRVYDALRKSPKWEKTLFLITFDENGGTYDHVAPWAAVPTGRAGSPKSHTHPERDAATHTQFGFGFDTFGIRVPTIVISPFVKPGTVFRSPTKVPFDHTSVIATILNWQGINPAIAGLGNRVALAPTFDGVLQESEARSKADMAKALRVDEIHTETTHDVMPTKAIRYGEPVHLRHVGNKWATGRPDDTKPSVNSPYFLGKPTTWGNWYYPTAAATEKQAIRIAFEKKGSTGNLVNGARVKLAMVAADMPKPSDVGYFLAAPEPESVTAVATTTAAPTLNALTPTALFLKQDDTTAQTDWRVWRVSSRVDGEAIYEGDEVLVFSERYAPQNLETYAAGAKTTADPYQRLALGPVVANGDPRFLRVTPGEWDIWRIERR